jgi:hypothetical protein
MTFVGSGNASIKNFCIPTNSLSKFGCQISIILICTHLPFQICWTLWNVSTLEIVVIQNLKLDEYSLEWNKMKSWKQNIKSLLKHTQLFQERDTTHSQFHTYKCCSSIIFCLLLTQGNLLKEKQMFSGDHCYKNTNYLQ